MIPKKKSNDDVELGLGKAGLASMETLDDSLKDQDTVDRAPVKTNGTEDIKDELKNEKLAAEEKLAAGERGSRIDICQDQQLIITSRISTRTV